MKSLTTRQRDLIQKLINSDLPIGIIDLANDMNLSQRQVNYELNRLKSWFADRHFDLAMKPGVGVDLEKNNEEALSLEELNEELSESSYTLVLSSKQRQQLLAIIFLYNSEPIILTKLEYYLQVSRTTVLKDIEVVESWLHSAGLTLARKRNYGFWIDSPETMLRQGIAALIWGEGKFGDPLIQLTIAGGLEFTLSADKEYLPVLEHVDSIIQGMDISLMLREVAYAEAKLVGRFIDDAVLFLSLIFAINLERIQQEQFVDVDVETIEMLKSLPVWEISHYILKRMIRDPYYEVPEGEIAWTAMFLISASRNGRWPGDLDIDESFTNLIDEMMTFISSTYLLPELEKDLILRDSIVIQLVPSCLRQRFQLWYPQEKSVTSFTNQFVFEERLAKDLLKMIEEKINVSLPDSEINSLAMILRAAYIRENSNKVENVIVVCPSGMATAQFLVARLKVRFPRLSNVKVVSLRDLRKANLSSTDLIISTVPVSHLPQTETDVIIVHPLLLPEDIEQITQWLNIRPL